MVARLRNRMVKADFWNDPELLRWPLAKRVFYQGLWATAEDSGCVEDDAFGWKLVLFPSPVDAAITDQVLAGWRDELIEARKLVPYEADGKRYLFLRTFHQHEHPRNPQSPDLPLPPWVTWSVKSISRKDGGENKVSSYEVDAECLVQYLGDPTGSLPTPYRLATDSPVLSSPVLPSPDLNISPRGDGFAPQKRQKAQKVVPVGPPEEDTAQKVVAFAVSRSRELGADLTTRQTGHLAAEVKKQFKAEADPTLILAAVGTLIDENKSPDTLGYVMRDLKKGGSGERTGTQSGRSHDGEWE
jgi:hypothetical protein